MALWSVKPQWKKSIIERQEWTKDSNILIVETGWRWGEFTVETEDDNPPILEAGVDIYNCDYPSELVETEDCCDDGYETNQCDEETCEWFDNFLEEGNTYSDLEEHGWTCDDTEMIIDCEMDIEMIEPTPTIETKTEPKSSWPN